MMVEVNNTRFSPAAAVSKAEAYVQGKYNVQVDMIFVPPGNAFTIEAKGWVQDNKVGVTALIQRYPWSEVVNSTSLFTPGVVAQPS